MITRLSDLAQYKERLSKPVPASIMDKEVTGVQGSSVAPDTLFYTEFEEADAEAYFDIFAKFGESFPMNSNMAIHTLEYNLKQQIKAMQNVSSVEIVLYASRCVKDLIENNVEVFNALKSIVAKCLKSDPDREKIAWYILSGWEWKQQLSLFVEAIGEANDRELIDFAMTQYDRIAQLCAKDLHAISHHDAKVLLSFVNMLFATQNGDYIKYIVDVVSHASFMNEESICASFWDKCNKTLYIKAEPLCSEFLQELDSRDLNNAFRFNMNQFKNRQRNMLKSNDEARADNSQFTCLTFGPLSKVHLNECKNKKENLGQVVRVIMDNINNIYPDNIKGEAYILLGTKSQFLVENERKEVVEFLNKEKEHDPNFELPIKVALMDLCENVSNDVFKTLVSKKYKEFWGSSIGSYFRYRKEKLADFLAYCINHLPDIASDENEMARIYNVLFDVIKAYNGNDVLLAKSRKETANMILNLACDRADYANQKVYVSILDMLEIVMKACPSQKKRILTYLDKVKVSLSRRGGMFDIEARVDKMIIEGDRLSEPD